jgi:hypothetical protein
MRGRIIYHRSGEPSYFVDGKAVTQEEFDLAFPPKEIGEPLPSQHPGCWPMQSDALAVHPNQIQEVMERNKRHGVHVEYNPQDGRAILADRGQRRDLKRVEGCHDNNGGYGD